jgi:hypothetical protein
LRGRSVLVSLNGPFTRAELTLGNIDLNARKISDTVRSPGVAHLGTPQPPTANAYRRHGYEASIPNTVVPKCGISPIEPGD